MTKSFTVNHFPWRHN